MKAMEDSSAVILKIDRSSDFNRWCGIESRCAFPLEVLRRACAFLSWDFSLAWRVRPGPRSAHSPPVPRADAHSLS
jgi:hypothetical protein